MSVLPNPEHSEGATSCANSQSAILTANHKLPTAISYILQIQRRHERNIRPIYPVYGCRHPPAETSNDMRAITRHDRIKSRRIITGRVPYWLGRPGQSI